MPKTQTIQFTEEEEQYIRLQVQQYIDKEREAAIQEEINRRINEYNEHK